MTSSSRAPREQPPSSRRIAKYVHLASLQDRNECCSSACCTTIDEMMPIVYTPTVGDRLPAVRHIYRRSRGLFVGGGPAGVSPTCCATAPR
jgi:malic enzyme